MINSYVKTEISNLRFRQRQSTVEAEVMPITRALNYTVDSSSFVGSRSTLRLSRRSNNLDPQARSSSNIAGADEP